MREPALIPSTLSLLILFAAACASPVDAPVGPSDGPGGKADDPGSIASLPVQIGEPTGPVAPDEIIDAISIEGDVLTISVAYGGGCEEHDFGLFWDGAFLESFPVQARLTLTHDDHGDACEAFITRDLAFDISSLGESYVSGYGGPGTVIVGVGTVAARYEAGASAEGGSSLVIGSPTGPVAADEIIDAISIEGDVLTISVAYAGGCEEHDFGLFWDGAFLESFPVQARLTLTHDDHGDACEAFVTRDIAFDISALGTSYVSGYGGPGTVIVGVGPVSATYEAGADEAAGSALIIGRPSGPIAPDEIVEAVSIEGNMLTISVGYGGGCEEHEFGLFFEGLFLETYPVQAPLVLTHEGNDDACEAFAYEDLSFDLSPLAEAYAEAYRTDEGTIVLHIGGRAVSYTLGGSPDDAP